MNIEKESDIDQSKDCIVIEDNQIQKLSPSQLEVSQANCDRNSSDSESSQSTEQPNQPVYRNKVRHWELKWVKTTNLWDFEPDIYTRKWVREQKDDGSILLQYKDRQKPSQLQGDSATKLYKCKFQECNKVFCDSTALKKHSLTHGERQYACPVEGCSKKFVDKSKLRRHQLVHTGEKPYRCDICNKYFSLDFNLRTHMRTHTGERPYTCKYSGCNKRFTQSSNLVAHEKVHYLKEKQGVIEIKSYENSQDDATNQNESQQEIQQGNSEIQQENKSQKSEEEIETKPEIVDITNE